MVTVVMVAVIVVVVVVVRVLVWATAIIDIVEVDKVLFIGVWADVDITSAFAVTVSYFGDMLSGKVVGALNDAIMGFLSDIGVEVLADANVNVFASLMTALEFALPKPLGGFSCCAAFGC